MKLNKLMVLLALALLGFTACNKDDAYEDYKEFAPASEVAGEYAVAWYLEDMTPLGYEGVINVYNASVGDSIWIDDDGTFWSFKVKAGVSGSSFSVNAGNDIVYGDNTTITAGSVSESGGIIFTAEWASDPGTKYVCKGTRRTGFEASH